MPRRPDITKLPLDEVWKLPPLTIEQVMGLPVSCPLAHAARACDIGRNTALDMAAVGVLTYMGRTATIHRVGREWRVALPDLLRVLGINDPIQQPSQVSA